jgi:hypothetical protein
LAVGYTNASWTLKCDLVAEYVCRVLNYLDAHDLQVCTPVAPDTDERIPLIDLNSGYVRRSLDHLPKQGPAAPWRLYQNYPADVLMLRYRSVRDKGVRFSRRRPATAADPYAGRRIRADGNGGVACGSHMWGGGRRPACIGPGRAVRGTARTTLGCSSNVGRHQELASPERRRAAGSNPGRGSAVGGRPLPPVAPPPRRWLRRG